MRMSPCGPVIAWKIPRSGVQEKRVPSVELVGSSADIGFVTPRDAAHAEEIVAEIRCAQTAAGREEETVHVFGDLVVFLGEDEATARDRKARLDDLAGEEYRSDATVFTGTPAGLADLLAEWRTAGLSGFRLRPGALPHDLTAITRGLVPELQGRGLFRTAYAGTTLREHLGLARPSHQPRGQIALPHA